MIVHLIALSVFILAATSPALVDPDSWDSTSTAAQHQETPDLNQDQLQLYGDATSAQKHCPNDIVIKLRPIAVGKIQGAQPNGRVIFYVCAKEAARTNIDINK